MPNYDEIIQKSQENVNALSQKLKALDKLHQDTIALRGSSDALPEKLGTQFDVIAKIISDFVSQFSEKLTTFNREIVRLSNIDLTKQFTNSQLAFIAQTRKDLKVELDKFEEKSDDLQVKIDSLNSEIERLVGTDLTNQFNDLQTAFIAQTRKDLKVELDKFEEKSDDFQLKINSLNSEIERLVGTDLTNQFNDLQTAFVAQTRKDLKQELDKFEEKSDDLQVKIDSLNSEIERLVGTDLTNQFNDLQTAFIAQTRKDLKQELDKFEEKSDDLQAKNEALEIQVDRLTKVDLDKGFDKLQKTLSDIFGSVNAINQTLTVITQNFTGIAQTLGTLQASIDTHHKETIQTLSAFSESTAKHLIDQDKEAKSNYESLDSRINLLSKQNELLRKEIKTNRVIQLIGFALTVAFLIYIVVKV